MSRKTHKCHPVLLSGDNYPESLLLFLFGNVHVFTSTVNQQIKKKKKSMVCTFD